VHIGKRRLTVVFAVSGTLAAVTSCFGFGAASAAPPSISSLLLSESLELLLLPSVASLLLLDVPLLVLLSLLLLLTG
jgi:hypothetical protein